MGDLNAALSVAAISTQKAVVGAEIVTQTLDTLNQCGPRNNVSEAKDGMDASYDFNKSVLSAVYSPTGAITDLVG